MLRHAAAQRVPSRGALSRNSHEQTHGHRSAPDPIAMGVRPKLGVLPRARVLLLHARVGHTARSSSATWESRSSTS